MRFFLFATLLRRMFKDDQRFIAQGEVLLGVGIHGRFKRRASDCDRSGRVASRCAMAYWSFENTARAAETVMKDGDATCLPMAVPKREGTIEASDKSAQ
jgi:hypothetical protein